MAMAGSATARPWVWNAHMPHAKRRGTWCCRRFLGCGRSTRRTCLCEASRLAVGNKARTQHSKRAGGRRAQKRAPNQEPGAAVGRPVGPGQESSAAGSGAKQSNAQTLERRGRGRNSNVWAGGRAAGGMKLAGRLRVRAQLLLGQRVQTWCARLGRGKRTRQCSGKRVGGVWQHTWPRTPRTGLCVHWRSRASERAPGLRASVLRPGVG